MFLFIYKIPPVLSVGYSNSTLGEDFYFVCHFTSTLRICSLPLFFLTFHLFNEKHKLGLQVEAQIGQMQVSRNQVK